MARFLDKLALAASTLIAFASTASAGINTWTGVGPEGGDITHLAITNSTPPVGYALTPKALYRSNDTGRTWAQVGTTFGQTQDLTVHPTQPNRVFIIADGDLLASTDGGVTRVKATWPADFGPVLSVEFSRNGALLYASASRVLYRSSDFGANWTAGAAISSVPEETLGGFYIDPANANRVLAALPRAGMWMTSDAGDHWTPMTSPQATTVLDIAFSPSGSRIWAATSDGLWYSSNAGASWTISSLTSPTRVIDAVAVDPIDPSLVYAQVHSSIYRSTDGGAQWTRGNGTYGLWFVNAFAFDPQVRERLLIGTLNGVWASADAGANWSRSNSGMVETTTSRFSRTPTRTYFVVRGEIHYLESGASVTGLVDPTAMTQALPFRPQEFLYTLHADRVQTGDRLFVGDGGLARSVDSGQTWTRSADPLVNNTAVNALDVAPENPNVVLAAASNSVVRSIDGGDHWSATSGLPEDAVIEILEFTSSNVAYAAGFQRVYRTTDAGLSWSRVELALGDERILSVLGDGDTTYLGTTTSGYRSTDGGVSWMRLPILHGGRFAADGTGVYFGGRVTSRSVDGGSTWSDIDVPGALDSTGLQLDTNGRLLSSTWYGGVQSYTVATDLAVTAAGQPSAPPTGGARTEILFTVTNRGPHAAAAIVLDIQVAGGRTFFENTDCRVDPAARSIAICRLGPLPTGQSKTVRIESSFETAGPLSITGVVAGPETDLVFANNTIGASWTYTAPASSSGGNGGGGGGGGALSWWMLLALAGIAAERRRVVCYRR